MKKVTLDVWIAVFMIVNLISFFVFVDDTPTSLNGTIGFLSILGITTGGLLLAIKKSKQTS